MIKIADLNKSFDHKCLFENISFEVDGDILLITGKSGCGKTTLLRIIAGFDFEYTGAVLIDDREMTAKVKPKDRNTAIVFQEPTLWKHMSVYKNITYGMKTTVRGRIDAVAKSLGIFELLCRYPEEISGGEAKRVSLARAVLSDKKNILLDEPLANVDEETKRTILSYLMSEYVEDKTIIYVTHDSTEIDMLNCKRIEL